MNLPRGELVRSRVVSHPAAMLETVLERELTGYAVFEPQDSLLLDAEGYGIITFEAGIPHLVYHTGTNRGGSVALADLAMPGPYSIDLFRVSVDELASIGGGETGKSANDWEIPPGMPAKRLAGDSELANRTREQAPTERKCLTSDRDIDAPSAVEAFLENDEKIDAIREQAREEAQRRAEEWGLDDQLRS